MSSTHKKKRKSLRLLLLGLCMVALIAALVIVIKYQNYQEELEESSKVEESFVYDYLWDYEESDLASIEIVRSDETVTLYAKNVDDTITWYQAEHPDASLDRTKSASLIALAERLSVYQLVKENTTTQERAAFGLQNPYAKITVTALNGESHTVWVGDLSTTGNYSYVLDVATGNVYSTTYSLQKYVAYTSIELYYTEIQTIYTSYTLGYAYLAQKGSQPIELTIADSSSDPDNYFYTSTSYRLVQPYDEGIVGVSTDMLGSFLDDLEDLTIEDIISVDATDEECEKYGVGAEPEYQVRLITYNTDSNGDLKQFETDYLFGYTYGDNDEYVYFRQNGDGIIYGVDVSGLTQFDFNSYDYIQKLIYLSHIDLIKSGSLEMNGEKYSFTLKTETNEDEETVYKATVNGKEVDEEQFKTSLRSMFLIMSSQQLWQDEVSYDESDKVVITYQFLDGTDKTLTFYRVNEFTYVIKMQDGLWMTCGYYQFNTMLQAFQTMMAAE
jgi:hypothetical protein